MLESSQPAGQREPSGGNTKSSMQAEYDFSQGERGRFYRENAELQLPVFLEDSVRDYLQARAKEKGIGLNDLVNALLKQDIALIEAAK